MRLHSLVRKVFVVAAGLSGGGALLVGWNISRSKIDETLSLHASDDLNQKILSSPLPTRAQQIKALQEKTFDILVIGGGATGCGVALDAASRGLSVAVVEKYDFASGTSSRSTKLIHGGVRYLQKAILGLDIEQYRMVKEALAERANLIRVAPHLAYPLPIMLPVYRWWLLPYYYAGIKCYDLVAGRQLLKPSYILSKSKALELFPMLKKDRLVGALVYYDGQQDDARMCLALALTSARLGASVTNYTEVVRLTKADVGSGDGRQVVSGAVVKDCVTGSEFEIRAKCVVNATGPFTDFVRRLDSPECRKICQPSSGVHIILPNYYSPENMGLLDPQTSDGRVIFFLPWQGATMAGTTDQACDITAQPSPSEREIEFILNEVRNYLSPDVNVRRGDVQSAWSGIRPLVTNPNSKDTQSLARNHIIEVSDSHLITIAGGKWTTYRLMAEETVDRCIETCGLKAGKSVTKGLLLEGAHGWTPTTFIRLIQDFGIDHGVAQHLANTYGDKAFKVAKLAQLTGKRWPIVGRRLHDDYPYLEAEVVYACREYACTAVDVLARRTRLAFLNVHAAEEALPKVITIMARELGWSTEKQKDEYKNAMEFLAVEMGLHLKKAASISSHVNFTEEEIYQYMRRFQALDADHKGYITVNDLRRYFKKSGEHVTENQLHEILSEVDLNKNAEVDINEYLQLMSALKSGTLSSSRLAKAAERSEEIAVRSSVCLSGGL
jgi:glycerol-3-phosphate dehydrogenase